MSFPTFSFSSGPFLSSITLELNSNPSFLLLIPDLASNGGDPFSHPSGSSALELHLKSVWLRAPNPESSGSRKRSVPRACSFSCQRVLVRVGPFAARASNPLLTHRSVESLSKAFSDQSVCFSTESGRLQSVPRALFTNPFVWLTAALLNYFIASAPVPGTSVLDRSGCPEP